MKKYLKILLLIVFLIPITVKAENLTEKVEDTSQKIYDYADLLSEEEERKLQDLSNIFIEEYNMDIVLVTISKNPYGVADDYTKEYAQDFYYYNNFGIGNKKSGIIFLIDMDNRYPYIATKGEAILMYDDERIEHMHDSAYNYLADESYYKAFLEYVNSASKYANKGIPDSNKYYCIDNDGEYYKCKEAPKSVNWIITIVAALLGSAIPVLIHIRKYKGIRLATNANVYLTNLEITNNTDRFLTTFTYKVRRVHDSGRSGGSHGGGSSISHGSGGSFGGGGGRHF